MKKTTGSVHQGEPDYTRPLLEIPSEDRKRLFARLNFLYGEAVAKAYMPELGRILEVYYAHKPLSMIEGEKGLAPEGRFSEKDVILITYGDLLRGKDRSPLATLARFCDTYLEGTIKYPAHPAFFPVFIGSWFFHYRF